MTIHRDLCDVVFVQELGWLGFLLFSDLSILPRRITLGDVLMRLCAGVYLRSMSVHFQRLAGVVLAEFCRFNGFTKLRSQMRL